PQSVAQWRGALLAPAPEKPGVIARLRERTEVKKSAETKRKAAVAPAAVSAPVPPPPDAPGPKGGLLDFVDGLKSPAVAATPKAAAKVPPAGVAAPIAQLPAALPGRVSSSKKRARPAPSVSRTRSLSRELKTKVILAITIASAAFIFQDQIPRLVHPLPSGITTGAITAGPAERSIAQNSEFRAHDGAVDALAFSGDGRLIVTAGSDRALKIWNAGTHTLQGSIPLEGGTATSLNVRNNRAVTAHADGSIAVYDLDSRSRLYAFKRSDASAWAAVFAGSEDLIASSGQDATVAMWETGTLTAPDSLLQGHASAVQALASDPAGRWLASGSADSTVKLWTISTRGMRRTLRGHHGAISTLGFAPDGTTLAAGSSDGAIKLWSASTGRALRTLNGHNARVTSIAFSANGDVIASAAEDGSVRVRGLKRARVFGALKDLGPGAKTVAFSNDGQSLLTGGLDGIVRLWPMPEPLLARRD
ncbi:MAG: WD40 repeat domain-containing protein, partial [Hyphomicrobium sp.]